MPRPGRLDATGLPLAGGSYGIVCYAVRLLTMTAGASEADGFRYQRVMIDVLLQLSDATVYLLRYALKSMRPYAYRVDEAAGYRQINVKL